MIEKVIFTQKLEIFLIYCYLNRNGSGRNELMKYLILFFIFIRLGISAEVDSFNKRFDEIPDMTDILNKKTISYFKQAVKDLNKKSHNCDQKGLYRRMRRDFKNHMTGRFNRWMINSKEVKVIYTTPKKSIYKYWDSFESFPIKLLSPLMLKKPAGVLAGYVRVGDTFLGTDKFEHFLGTGFSYFKSYFLNRKSIEETVQIGWNDEVGLLGGMTVGVMSFGDLAAEFNGMFFWNDILRFNDNKTIVTQENDYVANKRNGPYIICKNKKWSINKGKVFDWRNYVDDSFDEAINCSLFKTKGMVSKVKKALKELGQDGRQYQCPMSKLKFEKLKKKYGKYGPFILNSKGLGHITKKIKKMKWKKATLQQSQEDY